MCSFESHNAMCVFANKDVWDHTMGRLGCSGHIPFESHNAMCVFANQDVWNHTTGKSMNLRYFESHNAANYRYVCLY